jgi:hypothetical protein
MKDSGLDVCADLAAQSYVWVRSKGGAAAAWIVYEEI